MRLEILSVEAWSQCNCRCLMCDIWRRPEATGLDIERILADLPRLRSAGLEELLLTGGEPLMEPRLGELARPFRQAGVAVTLLSTGLLLEEKADDVVDWADRVILSVDGPPPVHDRIRRVRGAFDRLAAGVAAVRRRRPEMPLLARTVVQRENVDSLLATVDAVKRIGLDAVSFLAVDGASEAFHRPGGPDEDSVGRLLPDRDGLEALARQRPVLAADPFVVEGEDKLRRLERSLRSAALGEEPEAPPCNAPEVSAVLEADGTVRPCFFQPAYGRWLEGSLVDLIEGESARSFRHRLDIPRDAICRRCVCSLDRRS